MHISVLMHLIKTFEYLIRQLSHFPSRYDTLTEEIVVQIAVAAVFQGNKDRTRVLVPPKGFHKPSFVL
jgi:hypothetical protein